MSNTIAKTERERSKEYEQLNLQPERGLSDTRPHSDRDGTADRQIRQNEETVPHGTSDTLIPFPSTVRETVSPPIGDRPDSHQTNGADYGRLAESAASSRQDDPSDGMGWIHEQPQGSGRGNDTDGAYIQLTLFPTEQEQIQRIGLSEMLDPFSMPQTDIDHILRTGGNRNNSIFRIVSMYQKEKTTEKNIAFLQKEFGTGGTKVSVWYNKQGIHIAKGETALYSKNKLLVPWENVEQRITELLSEGQFAPQDAFSDAKDYEYQSLAERLWYLNKYINYIKEITRSLETMADGDLRIHLEQDYTGEFAVVKQALLNISDSLSTTISHIADAADQVNMGAEQVSSASQALASGATEQAATVEELNASIVGVTQQAEQNLDSVRNATEYAQQAMNCLEQTKY